MTVKYYYFTRLVTEENVTEERLQEIRFHCYMEIVSIDGETPWEIFQKLQHRERK